MKRHRRLAMESLDSRELLTSLVGAESDPYFQTLGDDGQRPVADMQYAENDLNLQEAESAGDAMIHFIPPDPQPWDSVVAASRASSTTRNNTYADAAVDEVMARDIFATNDVAPHQASGDIAAHWMIHDNIGG